MKALLALASAAVLGLSLAAPTRAAEPNTTPGPGAGKSRPKICLVLSGGGARGAAHVGVIKVLEQYRIPVSYTHLTLPTTERV